jgi:hypothetical protein
MYTKREKIIAMLEGFEKDPGENLVITVPIRHIPVTILENAFNEDLSYGELLLNKAHESILYKTTGIEIDTSKLDFFLGLVRDC